MNYKSILLLLICISFGQSSSAQYANEIGLSLPLVKLNTPELQLYYKCDLNDKFKLRAFVGFQMETAKEVRSDSSALNTGYVAYQIALGAQRGLNIAGLTKFKFYCGTDGYWNSKYVREPQQSYYGYFYNFGLRPAVGMSYQPHKQIIISLESRADFNINTQSYSPNGRINYDRKFSFKSFDHAALMLAYQF